MLKMIILKGAINMFLISMCGYKALDMADIKGYFVYEKSAAQDEFESFPIPKHEKPNAKYQVWANTRWRNPDAGDCSHYSIGEYEKADDAKEVISVLTSIFDPEGRVVLTNDAVILQLRTSEYSGLDSDVVLWKKNDGDENE